MTQYVHEKREKKVEMLERRTEEEGGFQPVIDSNSRLIANRTKEQRSLSNKVLNNSHCKHCDTAQQHEQLKNSQIKNSQLKHSQLKNSQMHPAKEIKLINKDKSLSAKENKRTPNKVKNPEVSQSKVAKAKTPASSKLSAAKTPPKLSK
jgi:hypothetical protein